MMARIVVEAEQSMRGILRRQRREKHSLSIAETICESIAHAAQDLHMAAIAVFTETGNTARMISKHRPDAPIYAFSHAPAVCNRMNLLWGISPEPCKPALNAEAMLSEAERDLLRRGRIRAGDVLGVVAGTQTSSGSTNFMRLHTVTAAEAERASSRGKHRVLGNR